MKKSINVDNTFSGMRIDRFLRKYFVSIPQSLIEKNLRNGKIKLRFHLQLHFSLVFYWLTSVLIG